jgi:hypothetical protein
VAVDAGEVTAPLVVGVGAVVEEAGLVPEADPVDRLGGELEDAPVAVDADPSARLLAEPCQVAGTERHVGVGDEPVGLVGEGPDDVVDARRVAKVGRGFHDQCVVVRGHVPERTGPGVVDDHEPDREVDGLQARPEQVGPTDDGDA